MNQDNLGGIKERIILHRLLGASIAVFTVFLFTFAIVPNLVLEASATQDVSAFASWSPVSLTLDPDYGSSDTTSTRGDVVFGSIAPTSRDTSSGSYGTQRVIKKTIGITSNGTYYTVFLSTSGSDNSLALDMENTDLSIPAIGNGSTTGVWSNPVAFSASGWGFSVPGTTIPASSDAVGTSTSSTPPAFTNVVTGANLGKDLTKALDSSIYNQDIWSAVPSSSTPQQIWKATSTSANGFGTYANSNNVEVTGDIVNDHFDIYYGIMVDTDILSGTYENEIVYTALASATSLDDVSTNLSRETYIIANGTEQTLHFDLSSSLANPTNIINKDNITIYLVPHATVASANYELTSAIKSAASTYTTCTINSNDDIVITGDGSGATLTCTSPDNTPADGTGLGEFDYWLHIDGYNYNYLSHYKKNEQDTATVAYIGLQSKLTDSNNELVITEMQEMSGAICKNTNTWNNIAGAGARILDYSGTTSLVADVLDENDDVDETATLAANTVIGIGIFSLEDTRDSKQYNIRRLADGNCWMVAALNINLADFAGKKAGDTGALTSENTDLNTPGKTYWDPTESTVSKIATYAQILEEKELSANFTGLSEILLGQAQSKTGASDAELQYQQNGTSGFVWNSYCSEPGVCELEVSETNEQAEIPRSANKNATTFYNWYAATAESGTFQMTNDESATDSICPKKWRLPVISAYSGINSTYVGSTGNTMISTDWSQIPLEFEKRGCYRVDGVFANEGKAHFWSATAGGNTSVYARHLRIYEDAIRIGSTYGKNYGFLGRCGARD